MLAKTWYGVSVNNNILNWSEDCTGFGNFFYDCVYCIVINWRKHFCDILHYYSFISIHFTWRHTDFRWLNFKQNLVMNGWDISSETALWVHSSEVKWAHDDVIKWKHFPRYWPFVWGIHRSPVNSPHKGQWCGALMFFFNLCLNKRLIKQLWVWWFETPSDYYDVTVIECAAVWDPCY